MDTLLKRRTIGWAFLVAAEIVAHFFGREYIPSGLALMVMVVAVAEFLATQATGVKREYQVASWTGVQLVYFGLVGDLAHWGFEGQLAAPIALASLILLAVMAGLHTLLTLRVSEAAEDDRETILPGLLTSLGTVVWVVAILSVVLPFAWMRPQPLQLATIFPILLIGQILSRRLGAHSWAMRPE
ncbi:MAG: hypothetical protein KBD16_02300 [Candidatus Pacebacteria bacterium]|nr:hypothetical protein [Candidatus Paceibacterota bacterium]